jgi:hypothetical protein
MIHNTVCTQCCVPGKVLALSDPDPQQKMSRIHTTPCNIILFAKALPVCNQCRGSGSVGSLRFGPFGSGSVPKCHKTVSDKYLFFKGSYGNGAGSVQKMSRIHNTFRNKRLYFKRSRDGGPSHRAGHIRESYLSPKHCLQSVWWIGIRRIRKLLAPLGSVSVPKKFHRSATLFALSVVNPDPYPKLLALFRSGSAPKNVTDPQHCLRSVSWIRFRKFLAPFGSVSDQKM